MDAVVKAKWIEALRSGRYIQGRGWLKKQYPDGRVCHCGGGVLVDVMNPLGWYGESKLRYHSGAPFSVYYYEGEATEIPFIMRFRAGLSALEANQIIGLNDAGTPFALLADYIERHL